MKKHSPSDLTVIQNSGFSEIHTMIKNFGFDYSSIGFFNKKILGSFSSVDWQRRYLELELYKSDNLTVSAIKQAETPVFWGALPLNTKKESLIMQSRYEKQAVCLAFLSLLKRYLVISFLPWGVYSAKTQFMKSFQEFHQKSLHSKRNYLVLSTVNVTSKACCFFK